MTDTRTPGTPTKRSGLWGPGLWLLGRFGDGGRRFGLAGLLLLILVGIQTWRWSVLPPQVGGALVAGVDLWLVLLGIDTLAGLGVAYVLLSSRQMPQGHLRALQRRLQLLAAGDLTAAAASPVSGPLAGVMADLQDRLTALRQDARAVSAGLDAAAQELHADAAGLVPWSARTAALARTCGTTGERLAAAARQAVSQLDDTAAQALQAAALAEEGRQALHDMVARMGRMRSTSTDITAVAGAIDALTLQTHLLALNASVEASRAGAHGAGFGVIADEVRRLARHSQEAAGQIQALVMATLHEVELGEECVRRTGLTIDSVVAASQGVADQVSAASGAAVTQCVGLGETASILVEVGQRTAYQARQAERTLTTAQDLCAGTAALSAQVSRWQLPAGAST